MLPKDRFCSAVRGIVRRLWLLLPLLLPATVVQAGDVHIVGVGDDCSNPPAGICFNPSPLVIQAGDTVRFYIYNANSFHGPHNVVADDGSFRCAQGCDGEGGDGSPRELPQWSFNRTFNVPGVVGYYDEVTKARGVLVVQEATAPAKLQTAYEYGYLAKLNPNSYFSTSSAEELATLSQTRWRPTFETFVVWEGPSSGAVPTCRFVDSVFGGHLYTPYVAECAALKTQPRWIYEGIAFHLKLPDENGDCPSATTPLFRLYNQSKAAPPRASLEYTVGAPLHRLTTNVGTLNEMRAAGWDFEGDSRTLAFACAAF